MVRLSLVTPSGSQHELDAPETLAELKDVIFELWQFDRPCQKLVAGMDVLDSETAWTAALASGLQPGAAAAAASDQLLAGGLGGGAAADAAPGQLQVTVMKVVDEAWEAELQDACRNNYVTHDDTAGTLDTRLSRVELDRIQELEEFALYEANLGGGVFALTRVLRQAGNLPKLKKFALRHCNLSQDGVAALMKALVVAASSLEGLSLYCCHIGDGGVKSVLEALHALPALRALCLGDNAISQNGVASLLMVLATTSCKLEKLDLSGNFMGDSGGRCIAAALKHPGFLPALWKLEVENNGFSKAITRKLKAVGIRRNIILPQVDSQ